MQVFMHALACPSHGVCGICCEQFVVLRHLALVGRLRVTTGRVLCRRLRMMISMGRLLGRLSIRTGRVLCRRLRRGHHGAGCSAD